MTDIGKAIIIIGVVCIVIGLLITFLGSIPGFGRLPGDILIKKDNVTFYFPLATSILISIILTIVFYFLNQKR